MQKQNPGRLIDQDALLNMNQSGSQPKERADGAVVCADGTIRRGVNGSRRIFLTVAGLRWLHSTCGVRGQAAALLDLVKASIPIRLDGLFVHAGSAASNAVPPAEKASTSKNALFGLGDGPTSAAFLCVQLCMPHLHCALL